MAETIGDMQIETEFLDACSRLQTAATGLQKLLNGKDLRDFERRGILYAADLIGQVSWDGKEYREKRHPELCVMATNLRPIFFKMFFQYEIPIEGDYCDRLCNLLRNMEAVNAATRQDYQQIQKVLQEVSKDILSGLQADHMLSDPD